MHHGDLASRNPPLHKFPVCDSRKVDDWSAATLSVFGPTQVEPQRGSKAFRALFNLCRLQRTALCYGSFDGAFSVSVPESVSFVQGMPIRGVGEHVNNGMKIPYSPRKGAVGAPGVLDLSYAARPRNLCRFHEAGRASRHVVRAHWGASGQKTAVGQVELRLAAGTAYDSRSR